MEINVENEKNEEDKGYLGLFHKGDLILYKGYYWQLLKTITKKEHKI